MPHIDEKVNALYLNKPECVIDLPKSLLSPEKIAQYKAASRLAIVEIAGRDSVAAAVKGVEEGFTDLLPTYAYTGTEYGRWASVQEAVERLSKRLPDIRVHDLVVVGSPGFWQALNGRFITALISRYGVYVPCVGCHLYLHSVRVPLALMLGGVPIISGERERHNSNVKANQISEVLGLYKGLALEFGVKLVMPLRHVTEGERVAEILGFDWPEGKEQLECVLSGNYRKTDGSVAAPVEQIERYMRDFALPCTRKIIEAYSAGRIPDHLEIAARVLES
jgi:hypothetical protein